MISDCSLGGVIFPEAAVHNQSSRLHHYALLGLLILALTPIPNTTALKVVALTIVLIWPAFMLRGFGCLITRKMADPVMRA
jgi:hypothetical protein